VEINWEEFKKFCSLKSKNPTHITNLVNYAKKYGYLLEVSPLDFALKIKEITTQKKSLKRHILQSLAALSKYLDLKEGSDKWYKKFKEIRTKAGITWTEEKVPQILQTQINKDEILESIKKMEERLKATCLLHLLTGLRTTELFYLIKNWEKLKKVELENGFGVELAYIKKTKKAFLTFLHKNAIPFIEKAYKSKRSYWKNIKKYGIKPYDFRRVFESIYSNLRSHEIDLLQGRLGSELTIHYTRDLSGIGKRVFQVQDKVLKEIIS
jgi:intergrase/recombinase